MHSCQLLTIVLLAAFCYQQVSTQETTERTGNGNVFESAFQLFKTFKYDAGNLKNLPDSIQQALKQIGLDFNKGLNCNGVVQVFIKFVFRPEYVELIEGVLSQVLTNPNFTAVIRAGITRAIEAVANIPFIGDILKRIEGFLNLSPDQVLKKIKWAFDLLQTEPGQNLASGLVCDIFKGSAGNLGGLAGLLQ